MDNLNPLLAAQLKGMNVDFNSKATAAANSTQFDDLLNSITGESSEAALSAAEIQQQVLEKISQRVEGAPNYLYSLHPKVYEKMQDDPEFMTKMLGVVDDWTSSAAFGQAQSASALSSLLVGEDGEYAMSSSLIGAIGAGGSGSILDFVVSSGSLQAQGNFRKFLEQFDNLPEGLADTLTDNLNTSQVAGAQGYNSSYYEAMAAMTEAQKRLMDIGMD